MGIRMMNHMLDTFWDDPTEFLREVRGQTAIHAIAAWGDHLPPIWVLSSSTSSRFPCCERRSGAAW
jgi:hypothetical protein